MPSSCSPPGAAAAAPAGALELDGRGTAAGRAEPARGWFPEPHGTVLAVFTTPGCGLCRRVAGAADALAQRGVTVRRFDEVGDPDAWAAARVPGAPYAVALGPDGHVLAKGTVNDGAQLASVIVGGGTRAAARASRRAFLRRAGGRAGRRGRRRLRRAGPARPRRITSAATPTPPTAARTRPGCRGSTAAGCPLRAADGRQVDDLGRLIDRPAVPSTRTARRSPISTAARCLPRRARPSAS